MSDLTQIPLKLSYRTGRDDLVHDFFVPCLETAVLYRRAAGYFTSAELALAARGVASLALRRGRCAWSSPRTWQDSESRVQAAIDHSCFGFIRVFAQKP